MQDSVKDAAEEEQGQSNSKVMCRLCFSGEHEGSEKVSKMLPCNSCGKKYHRNCLKAWSQNRGNIYDLNKFLDEYCTFYDECRVADLFHWSSWTCPSCRICEVKIVNFYYYNHTCKVMRSDCILGINTVKCSTLGWYICKPSFSFDMTLVSFLFMRWLILYEKLISHQAFWVISVCYWSNSYWLLTSIKKGVNKIH